MCAGCVPDVGTHAIRPKVDSEFMTYNTNTIAQLQNLYHNPCLTMRSKTTRLVMVQLKLESRLAPTCALPEYLPNYLPRN
jgi:hypothetical protein